MFEFLTGFYEYFLLGHLVAVALGLGAATITDVLFFKFLKDFKLAHEELQTLNTMSQVIWVVLVVAVICGLGLYLPQMEQLNRSPVFLVKMISFGVILLNGIGLNLLIAPRLEQIFTGQPALIVPRYWRRLAMAGGAVSIVSWYTTFLLAAARTLSADFEVLLGGYLLILAAAIVVSQIMEMSFAKRSDNNLPMQ